MTDARKLSCGHDEGEWIPEQHQTDQEHECTYEACQQGYCRSCRDRDAAVAAALEAFKENVLQTCEKYMAYRRGEDGKVLYHSIEDDIRALSPTNVLERVRLKARLEECADAIQAHLASGLDSSLLQFRYRELESQLREAKGGEM